MADWHGVSRSNWFQVKHPGHFIQWVGTLPGVYWQSRDVGEKYEFALFEQDGVGWPTERCGEEGEEDYVHIPLHEELSEHLLEGEVAVLEEIGHEKMRYLTAWAVAINHKGEVIKCSISDIYGMAAEAGWGRPTSAAY